MQIRNNLIVAPPVRGLVAKTTKPTVLLQDFVANELEFQCVFENKPTKVYQKHDEYATSKQGLLVDDLAKSKRAMTAYLENEHIASPHFLVQLDLYA